ncbi:MAG: SH3 domain-containing protein, partial [Niameybacter sp.]
MKKLKASYVKIIVSSVLAVSLLASCSTDKKPTEEILVSGKLLPNITTEMQDYRFWCANDKNSDEVLLTTEQIDTLVTSIKKSIPNSEINLSTSGNVISGEELISIIENYSLPPYEYVDGKLKNSKFESNLIKTIGTVSIPKEVTPSYGILVSNTPLKILPTSSVLTKSATDNTSDYLLSESLKLGNGVLVYHKTYDQNFSFVQSSKGFGWVLSSSIATTSKEE